jgi:hypothetical protein
MLGMNGWITKFKIDEPVANLADCSCVILTHGTGRFRSNVYNTAVGGWVLDAEESAFFMYGPLADPDDPDAWAYKIPLDYDEGTNVFSLNGKSIGAVVTDPNSANFGKFVTTADFWNEVASFNASPVIGSISKNHLDIVSAGGEVVSPSGGGWRNTVTNGSMNNICNVIVESIGGPEAIQTSGSYTSVHLPCFGGKVGQGGYTELRYIVSSTAPVGTKVAGGSLGSFGSFVWRGPGFYWYKADDTNYALIQTTTTGSCDSNTTTPVFKTNQPGYGNDLDPLYLDGQEHTPGNFQNVVEAAPTGGVVVQGYSSADNQPGVYFFSVKLELTETQNQYVASVSEEGITTITPSIEYINPAILAYEAILNTLSERIGCNHKNVKGCKVDTETVTVGVVVPDLVPPGCQVSIGAPTITGIASATVAANQRDIFVSFYPPKRDNPEEPNIPDEENPDEGGEIPGEDDIPDDNGGGGITTPGGGGGGPGGGTPVVPPPDPTKVVKFVPQVLDFQETGINKTKELLFSIQNQGTTSVPVTKIIPAFSTASGDFYIQVDLPRTLAPGQSVAGKVTFWPKTEAVYQEVFYAVTTGDAYLDALTLLGFSTPTGPGDPTEDTSILKLYDPSLTTSNIIFIDTLVGEDRVGFMYARSEGTLPVNFSNISFIGPWSLTGTLNPQVLQPDQVLEIPLSFAPTANGTVLGSANVGTNADNAEDGIVSAQLIGAGYGYTEEEPPPPTPAPPIRTLELLADTQDFGVVNVGSSKDLTFQLIATGTHPVTVNLLNTRDDIPIVFPKAFQLIFDNYPALDGSLENGFTLAPGSTSLPITLRFIPDREVSFSTEVFHQWLSNATAPDWGWIFTGIGYDPSNDIPGDPPTPTPGPDPEPGPGNPPPPSNNIYPDGVGPACIPRTCVVRFIYKQKL